MPKTIFHGRAEDLPMIEMDNGALKRSAIRTDDALVVFNYITPGMDDHPPHDHPFDQLCLVFGGAMELTVDGTSYIVENGGYLYIPAGLPHGGKLIGDEPSLGIDVFSPPRRTTCTWSRTSPNRAHGGSRGDRDHACVCGPRVDRPRHRGGTPTGSRGGPPAPRLDRGRGAARRDRTQA